VKTREQPKKFVVSFVVYLFGSASVWQAEALFGQQPLAVSAKEPDRRIHD
jgi:hypothetical protein